MAEDPDLSALRQKRLEELKNQAGLGAGGMANESMSDEQRRQQEEAQREAEAQRQAILTQILHPDAKERLSRIGLVKPDKQRQIENMLISRAQSGRLGGKVSEDELIQLLEQINEKSNVSSKVTFQRRRNIMDDED